MGEEWNVTRTPYNAPGLLIWHRDQSHSMNDLGNNLFDPPSIGSKGTVLLVDAHYEPARLRGAAAAANPSLLDNLGSGSRPMMWPSDRSVGTRSGTAYPTSATDPYAVACNKFGARNPIARSPTRRPGIPGLEYRPDLDAEDPLFFRDVDASTVVPSKGNEIYSTRIVDRDGSLLPALYGTDLGGGHVLGTGNPKDGRPAIEGGDPGTTADLSLGVRIRVLNTNGKKNTKVRIAVRPGHKGASATLTKTGQR